LLLCCLETAEDGPLTSLGPHTELWVGLLPRIASHRIHHGADPELKWGDFAIINNILS
jgi:hypothetical protein